MNNTYLDRFSLKGKVILLTGGNGLYGRGLTSDLAAAGAELIVASRDRAATEKVAAEECALGRTVHAATLDQGAEESVIALRGEIASRFGRLDGLVNNAVVRTMREPKGTAAQFAESMRVNATGLFLMHRHLGELMAETQKGSIVNIGSIQGMVGVALDLYEGMEKMQPPPDYFFHKGGMANLTRYYAGMLGPSGVRVNCIAAGGFFNAQPEKFLARYSAQTFLGRMAGKDDLGGTVVFLLSDASAYITGVHLPVDGGYTAR